MNFSCQLNPHNGQVNFFWSNLTASSYTNLTISLTIDEKKSVWIISCDPYLPYGNCSTKPYRLEPGKDYEINAKLKKNFPNHIGQKLETCLIKTSNTNKFLHQSKIHVHLCCRSQWNSYRISSTWISQWNNRSNSLAWTTILRNNSIKKSRKSFVRISSWKILLKRTLHSFNRW